MSMIQYSEKLTKRDMSFCDISQNIEKISVQYTTICVSYPSVQ